MPVTGTPQMEEYMKISLNELSNKFVENQTLWTLIKWFAEEGDNISTEILEWFAGHPDRKVRFIFVSPNNKLFARLSKTVQSRLLNDKNKDVRHWAQIIKSKTESKDTIVFE